MSVELSPGFFNLNNPVKYADIKNEDIQIIPVLPEIEPNKHNMFVKVIKFLISTQKPCGCDTDGWTRTSTY